MKLAIPLGLMLALAALAPSHAHAQQPITAPPPAGAVSPGFNHVFQAGLVRSDSGWVARDYPRVSSVVAGSAAERAGVRAGDQIISLNGRNTRRPPLFRDLHPGDTVVLRVRRADTEREIRFQLPQ